MNGGPQKMLTKAELAAYLTQTVVRRGREAPV